MARTKTNTQNNTKIRRTPRRNIVFVGFLFFNFFFIYNFLNEFSKKVELPPWYGQRLSMTSVMFYEGSGYLKPTVI